jgi:hypothetical protein
MPRIQVVLAARILVVALAVWARDPARRMVAMDEMQDFLDSLRALKPQS